MSESGSTWAVQGRDMCVFRCHFNFTKKIQQPTVRRNLGVFCCLWTFALIATDSFP